MVKTDIVSGFLGAGKTTLIKKLLADVFASGGEKVAIVENEFGKVGIDGGFLKDSGFEIAEINSGCICCSLQGDFVEALKKLCDAFHPDRIIIEPSGVGKLSDVANRIKEVEGLELNCMTSVIDATKCKMYLRNFEEFYENQIRFATSVVLSRTSGISRAKLDEAVTLIRQINPSASLVTTPWEELSGRQLLDAMENTDTAMTDVTELLEEYLRSNEEHHNHHHHHDEECDDPDCECHHHGDKEEDHHHHHNSEEEEHHHHHHHHEDGEECDDPDCECHHHGHDADDVFASLGFETAADFSPEFITECLGRLDSPSYGMVLRAKGIVRKTGGGWLHFDYVPGEVSVRDGSADITGKLCVIGSGIDREKIANLFGI